MDDSTNPLFAKLTHEIMPFFEVGLDQNSNHQSDPKIPFWFAHILYNSLPKIIDSGCRIIFICWDPKDRIVSHWYFVNKVMIESLYKRHLSYSVEESLITDPTGIMFWDTGKQVWNALRSFFLFLFFFFWGTKIWRMIHCST